MTLLFITVYCFPGFSHFEGMGSVPLECSSDTGSNEKMEGELLPQFVLK